MLWRLAGYTLSEVLEIGLDPLQRELSSLLHQPISIVIRDVAFVGTGHTAHAPETPRQLLRMSIWGDFSGEFFIGWPVGDLLPFILRGRAPSDRVSVHDAEAATEVGGRIANGMLAAINQAWGLSCGSGSPRLCDRGVRWGKQERALMFRLKIQREGSGPAMETLGLLSVDAAEEFERVLRRTMGDFLDTLALEAM